MLKEIFTEALELPPEKRAAFLDKACGSDVSLRKAIEDLLAAHERAGDFLEHAPGAFFASDADEETIEETMIAAGSKLCGRYRILGLLGRGGMGEVYEAFDEELSTSVAVKVLARDGTSAEHQARFRREILMARSIVHPNVCHVFDYHRDDGRDDGRDDDETLEFISMERLSGETLAARLARGRIPQAEALEIVRQVCSGVAAFHRKGIIHRDLKPGNIMLSPAESGAVRAVIMDFGLARETEASAGDQTQFKTVSGQVFGTPAYIAPEQLRGEMPTAATDLYALGLIFYEMLAGTRPFGSGDKAGAGWRRLTDNPANLNKRETGVSAWLNGVVMKCLERNPENRFQSADELLSALEGRRPAPKFAAIGIAAGVIVLAAATLYLWNPQLLSAKLPAEKHVVVLAIGGSESIGMDPAFADGLAGTLTARLAKLEQPKAGFWVVPFGDVQRFGIHDPSGGRTLVGANLALEGTLRKKGSAIECELELRDTATGDKTGSRLRHRRFRVPTTELSLLGTAMFENAAALLEIKPPTEMSPDSDLSSTAGPGAWEFYQQGFGYLQRYGADQERAAAMFRRAVEADKTYTAAWAGLAQAYVGQFSTTKDPRWLDQGEEAARHALALDPDRARVHLSLGMIHFNRGDFPDAIRNFQTAFDKDATLTAAVTMLARSHESLGQNLQAEELYQKVIQMAPDYWSGYNDLGLLYYRNGQYAKAEPLFRTVTELAPDNPLAFANLGGVLLAEDKYGEARTALERALALKPGPGVYSNLGTALYWEKKYGESATMFRKAVDLTPKDSRLWRNLGDALEEVPDQKEAAQAYTACADAARGQMERRAASPVVLSVYAICLAKTGSGLPARQTIEKALARSPADSDVQFHAALVYAVLGNQTKALDALDRIYTAGYPHTVVLSAPELALLHNTQRFQKWVTK